MILGCICDDFTGASDLGNTLSKAGMHTVQFQGVTAMDVGASVEAGVVALKSRTIPALEAIQQSLAALDWLKRQGCQQFYFKYCSTFDSTHEGNIGPVAEALSDALGANPVIFCPAFPAAGRTVYQGHLFVGDRLLSESGMQHHPLTPMSDPDLRRVLRRQGTRAIGHIPLSIVRSGPQAVGRAFASEAQDGRGFLVVDAITEADLLTIGTAARNLVLVTGGSGAAMGLAGNFRADGLLAAVRQPWEGNGDRVAALAGSTSKTTLRQAERHREAGHPVLEVKADELISGRTTSSELISWFLEHDGVPLAYSSIDPDRLAIMQSKHGRERLSTAFETLFAEVAFELVARGYGRLVCAGGETSGAIVTQLGVEALEIGPEIDPGVPALRVHGGKLSLALKSGNFGADDFFEKAARRLARHDQ